MHTDELTHLGHLGTATLDVKGRMPWSSNATFLVDLVVDGTAVGQAVYKPLRGERPLWDFEPGLHRRETAAYRLSAAMGLGIVPPTIVRDGPYGEGSVQWFVDADHRHHYFTIFESRPELHDRLRAVALFDVVANNTDRKSGHVLVAGDDIWAIDNGLCFSTEFKLRTVIWEFGGEPISDTMRSALESLVAEVPAAITELLDPAEVDAMAARAAMVLETGVLPVDHTGHRYPWPLV